MFGPAHPTRYPLPGRVWRYRVCVAPKAVGRGKAEGSRLGKSDRARPKAGPKYFRARPPSLPPPSGPAAPFRAAFGVTGFAWNLKRSAGVAAECWRQGVIRKSGTGQDVSSGRLSRQ